MNSINDVTDTEDLADLALQIAQSQVGQSEKPIGSNGGPMVNEYLEAVGLSPGFAWCQAFVYWCYATAAKKLNLPNPVVKTGGVHDCWNRCSTGYSGKKLLKEDMLKQPKLLKPGDQFILLLPGNTGHTGLIEKIDDSIIYTIEGNSNNTGSREGYEVVRHKRDINDKALQGFIQYS